MFVLELSYTAPLEAVDALLPDHVAWLDGLTDCTSRACSWRPGARSPARAG